jgi:hypothetical protein
VGGLGSVLLSADVYIQLPGFAFSNEAAQKFLLLLFVGI